MTHIGRSAHANIQIPVAGYGPSGGFLAYVEISLLDNAGGRALIEHPAAALQPLGGLLLSTVDLLSRTWAPDSTVVWHLSSPTSLLPLDGSSLAAAVAAGCSMIVNRRAYDPACILVAAVNDEGVMAAVGNEREKLRAAVGSAVKRAGVAMNTGLSASDISSFRRQGLEIKKLRTIREAMAFATRPLISRRQYVIAASVAVSAGAVSVATSKINALKAPAEMSNRIVVFPFVELNPAAAENNLGPAMADALLARMRGIRSLDVRSSGSFSRHVRTDADAADAGKKLGVRFAMRGSVQMTNDAISVTVQLLHVRDSAVIWSDRIDGRFSDVFRIQDTITDRLIQILGAALSEDEKRRVQVHQTDNLEAYRLYLKGRYSWSQRTDASLVQSIKFFELALKADSRYALAYTGLADAYAMLAIYGVQSPRHAMPRAEAAASEALRIDDTLAEAHTSLAGVMDGFYWDWRRAISEYKRAIDLDANYPVAHQWYAICLTSLGNIKGALSEIDRAKNLDPVSPSIHTSMAWILYFDRRYDEAITQLAEILTWDSAFHRARWRLGLCLQMKGLSEAAMHHYKIVSEAEEPDIHAMALLSCIYSKFGRKKEGTLLREKLLSMVRTRYVSQYSLSLIPLSTGDKDGALTCLEQAYNEHDSWMAYLKVDPLLDALRSEPRFQRLLALVAPNL